jgi:hypothetical protein
MFRACKIIAFCLMVVLPLGCSTTTPTDSKAVYPETVFDGVSGVWVPAGAQGSGGIAQGLPLAESYSYQASGPFPIGMDSLPTQAGGPDRTGMIRKPDVGRIENQISDEMADRLRAEALLLPPSLAFDETPSGDAELPGLSVGAGFESLDASDCCGGGVSVPPDPELAVGPNHIIAVVNTAFEIYDKSGNSLAGPTTFASFFSEVPNCANNFDPNVLYDEEYDRFIIGVDANGVSYCVAATTGPDPTGTWNRYGFPTNFAGLFFDYPHAGVGMDEIYLGANMFSSGFVEGRVWAMDKDAMYSGAALGVVTRSTGTEGTPQPMNLHGFAQGTWPVEGPHYFLTDGPFDGAEYGVWSWEDPFGADTLTNRGSVNLNDFTAETAGYPIDAPQSGTFVKLQANDWRVQDAEYRNGLIWMANTQACNPGGGTVDCVRWASIDPTGTPVIIDAGVFGSDGEYRIFADVAANDCDDMAIGYSKSSPSMFPSVWVSGRESADEPGTLRPEVEVKAGERDYDSFQSGVTHRWGDYTGMTIDPDGKTFWYLGQYSKTIENFSSTTWATYIGSFTFPGCAPPTPLPGQAYDPAPADAELDVLIDAPLAWIAGANATSHDVYFGANPIPEAAEFQGNQADTGFVPGALDYETTYYWRIDEVNDTGTAVGNVWSFTTQGEPVDPAPGEASSPVPADGEINVSIDSGLSWAAGVDTTSHDVYFGTNSNPDAAEFQGNQAETGFAPVSLDYSTTYFWRVDEVNDAGTTSGPVWSFTTVDEPVPASVHIARLSGSWKVVSKRSWIASVEIRVEESTGAPVAGVTVVGDWGGGVSGSASCSTDGGGACSVQIGGLSLALRSVDFTVSDLTGPGVSYDPGANEDDNGGVISVHLFGIPVDPNLLPSAADDNYTTIVGVAVGGNVLDNDDQGDAPATVTGFDAVSANGGSVAMAASGVFTYTPPAAYQGSDSFAYTITDNNGDSDSATVTITIDADAGGLILTVSADVIKGRYRVAVLDWNRVESAMVEIYRDGNLIRTTTNSGTFRDVIGLVSSQESYEYRVCEVQPAGGCATATANF